MEGSVFEVGLRDGLQSEKTVLDLSQKLSLLKKIVDSGVRRIELGSFVRPDRIPQLSDTESFVRAANKEFSLVRDQLEFWAFVPNKKGLERALEERLDGVCFFYACSETFSQMNINRSLNQAFSEIKELVKEAQSSKLKTRAYLSTIVYCPYEGPVSEATAIKSAQKLLELGFDEIALSDTTGHALPHQVESLCGKLMKKASSDIWALHMHDTRGLALANVWEGLKAGLKKFDSSLAGLGGCPYAPGASGNLATEDLAYLLKGACGNKDIDMMKLAQAGFLVEKILGRKLSSKVLRSLESQSVAG